MIPDKTGKRGGRPRFKKAGELRSFEFSRVNHPKAVCFLEGSTLRIPKLGAIPVIVHRPVPDGFTPKTATIIKAADGWYISISLEDESIPEPIPLNNVKTVVGVDVGLKDFLTTSSAFGEEKMRQALYNTDNCGNQQITQKEPASFSKPYPSGETVPIQQAYRKNQKHLARQQRKLVRHGVSKVPI